MHARVLFEGNAVAHGVVESRPPGLVLSTTSASISVRRAALLHRLLRCCTLLRLLVLLQHLLLKLVLPLQGLLLQHLVLQLVLLQRALLQLVLLHRLMLQGLLMQHVIRVYPARLVLLPTFVVSPLQSAWGGRRSFDTYRCLRRTRLIIAVAGLVLLRFRWCLLGLRQRQVSEGIVLWGLLLRLGLSPRIPRHLQECVHKRRH